MCSEEKEAPLLLSVPLAAVSLFVLVILASFESVSVHLSLLLSEVDGGGLPGQLPAVQGQQGGQRLLPEATHPHPLPQAGLQQGHGAEQVPPGHPHLPLCL